MGVWVYGVWGMGSGGRTACDVCGLHLRLSSLQLFSFFYAAAQLMSLPICESPLPKGAPYLDDPAQIVMPQNEFVIRNDAGLVKKDCGLKNPGNHVTLGTDMSSTQELSWAARWITSEIHEPSARSDG